jgi:hypothetical protein
VKHLLLSIILLAAAHCQAAPILPEEAKSHLGESVSIRGMVEQPATTRRSTGTGRRSDERSFVPPFYLELGTFKGVPQESALDFCISGPPVAMDSLLSALRAFDLA